MAALSVSPSPGSTVAISTKPSHGAGRHGLVHAVSPAQNTRYDVRQFYARPLDLSQQSRLFYISGVGHYDRVEFAHGMGSADDWGGVRDWNYPARFTGSSQRRVTRH